MTERMAVRKKRSRKGSKKRHRAPVSKTASITVIGPDDTRVQFRDPTPDLKRRLRRLEEESAVE